jgi:hypothetical protein
MTKRPTPIYRDPLGLIAIAYAVFHYGWVIPAAVRFIFS